MHSRSDDGMGFDVIHLGNHVFGDRNIEQFLTFIIAIIFFQQSPGRVCVFEPVIN